MGLRDWVDENLGTDSPKHYLATAIKGWQEFLTAAINVSYIPVIFGPLGGVDNQLLFLPGAGATARSANLVTVIVLPWLAYATRTYYYDIFCTYGEF